MADEFMQEVERLRRERSQAQGRNELTAGVTGQVADIGRSLASGVGRGAVGLAGMPADVMNMADDVWQHGWAYILNKFGALTDEQAANIVKPLPGTGEAEGRMMRGGVLPSNQLIQRATDAVIGPQFQPETPAGEYAQTIGENIPGAVLPGLALEQGLARTGRAAQVTADIAKQAVLPGVAAQAAGDVAQNAGATDWQQNMARLAAGAAGGATGAMAPQPRAARPLPGYDAGAVERVGRAVEHQGGPAAVGRELETIGPEAMLMDTGTRLRGQAEALTGIPGPQQDQILQALHERHRQAGDVISQRLDQALGQPAANFAEETEQLLRNRSGRARGLYGEAERVAAANGPVDTAPIVQHIESRMPTSVAAGATERMTSVEQALMRQREILGNRTDYASLHEAKVSLDGDIQAARSSGNTSVARALEGVRDRLVATIDEHTRDPRTGESHYARARNEYASDSAILDARERGQSVFDRATRADELALEMRRMTEGERIAFQQGARDNLMQIMDNVRNDAGTAVSTFDKNAVRQKMRLLLGAEQANDLIRMVEGQARMQGTRQRAVGQSATFGRQQAAKEFPNPVDPAPVAPPTLTGLAIAGGNKLLNAATAGRRERSRETLNTDAARLLMRGQNEPQTMRLQLLEDLQRAYGNRLGAQDPLARATIAAQGADVEQPPFIRSRNRP